MSQPTAHASWSRRRGVLVVAMLAIVGAASLVVDDAVPSVSVGHDDGTTTGGRTSGEAPEVAARRLLADMERTWDARRKSAFTTSVAESPRERRAAAATWQAWRDLRVDALHLRWIRPVTTSGGPSTGAAAALVEATWTQHSWPSSASAKLVLELAVRQNDGGEPAGRFLGLSASLGDPVPLWAMAPLDVRATPAGATVVGLPGQTGLGQLVPAVDAAHRQVSTLLPTRHPSRMVVVVPGTAAQFAALRGGQVDHGAVGAATATVDGSTRANAAGQVLLNPEVFPSLDPVAARVVLAHELTHLRTGAAAADMPLWIAEGFADFVALRAEHVPVRTLARSALRTVRRTGPPPALPSAADFAAQGKQPGRAYELAWLAFRTLRAEAGVEATIGFHRAVSRGHSVDAALREHAGLGIDQLTRAWRANLTRLARASG